MRRSVLAGLLVMLCAGLASAWFVLGDRDTPESDGGHLAEGDAALDDSGSPLDRTNDAPGRVNERGGPDNGGSLDSPTTAERVDESDPSREATGGNSRGSNPNNPVGNPDNPGSAPGEIRGGSAPGSPTSAPGKSNEPPAPDVIPHSARDPTMRERVARSRYGHGKLPTPGEIPKVAEEGEKPPLDLSKLAEPEIWAEYWAREGYTPPAMVKTPVRGKVMSLLTNTQVPGAKIRLFTFFPATSRLNGPVLPVIMETVADEQGFFESNLPAPKAWPSDYPRYALSIEWEGRRLVDCAPYDNLRAGEHNEIGVFWAPEEPYEVEVSVTTAETGLTVAATGRVDPRRWEGNRAERVFENLPKTQVGTAGSKVSGTWDFLKADSLPYLTLLHSGGAVLTRQCVIHPDEKVRIALDAESFALFFEESPLDGVLSRFQTEAGVPVSHTENVDGDAAVSLDIGRTTFRQALDHVAEYLEIAWRIENGGVVFHEATVSNPPEAESQPFLPVVFPNDGSLTLSGTVADEQGAPIHGAVLTLTVNGEDVIGYSDPTGWFAFHGLPDKTLSLNTEHELYLSRRGSVHPGVSDVKIELTYKRPKFVLKVVNDSDNSPVTEVWLDGETIIDVYAQNEVIDGFAERHLFSATGEYLIESDRWIRRLHVQAFGYRPHSFFRENLEGTVEVRLTPGVVLERRPRDYDAAQSPNLFQTDEGDGPGLWSLDDDHWVEYSFDFGEEENAYYDLVLGVTNHTFGTLPLDNEYLFEVRVWVDGKSGGTMQIASDPNVAQIGRISLRSLTGTHTVRIMWLNDRYIPGQLDANIRYESLRIMEVP